MPCVAFPDTVREQRFCRACGVALKSGVRFCVSCGTPSDGTPAPPGPRAASPPNLFGSLEREDGETFVLNPDVTTLGRADSNNVVAPDPLASREHCRIEWRGDSFWVVDLESANSTYVNNAPVREQPLHPEDAILVGDTIFVFHCGPTAAGP